MREAIHHASQAMLFHARAGGNFLFSRRLNAQCGGKRTTKGHYNVPMRDCAVALDDDAAIDGGQLADEQPRITQAAL